MYKRQKSIDTHLYHGIFRKCDCNAKTRSKLTRMVKDGFAVYLDDVFDGKHWYVKGIDTANLIS